MHNCLVAANNNNGRDHDAPSGGSGSSSVGSVSGSKRKRLLSNVNNDVDPAPLLRTVLGPHLKAHDIPGLFPFRLGADASSSADDRTHLAYLPMMAYAEVRYPSANTPSTDSHSTRVRLGLDSG